MGGSEWVSTSVPYLFVSSGVKVTRGPRRPPRRVAGAASASFRLARWPRRKRLRNCWGCPCVRRVVARRRVMYLDGEPCELTDTYYPVSIAGGTALAGTAKIRGGAIGLLADLGHVGVRVREDVTARLASGHEREQLGLAVYEPVLQLTRLTLDDEDRPIQVDIMAMPPRRQKLRYEIRIG